MTDPIETLKYDIEQQKCIVARWRKSYDYVLSKGDHYLADSYRDILIRELECLMNMHQEHLTLITTTTDDVLTALGINYTREKGLFYINE